MPASKFEPQGKLESEVQLQVIEVVNKKKTPDEGSSPPIPVLDFPDGGMRAWLVVFGTALSAMSSFGYVTSWGVYQSYYEQTLLKGYSPSTIAWIGSLQFTFVFLPALPIGRLFDLGHFRIPYAISSIALIVSTFLTGQCTKYWQLILCQGILQGCACGCIFAPTIGIIGHWFKKNRGLAISMMAIGSSLGGTFFPIATRRLIYEVGFKWAMRILGFILIFCLLIPNITLRRRLPPRNVKGGLYNWAVFRNPAFTFYALGGLCTFLGLYTIITYIDIAAVTIGISDDSSFYLIAICNASSALGRLGAGLVVDKTGALNLNIPATFIAAIITFAWPFAGSYGSLVAIAIIYGIMYGVYVSLYTIPLFEMGDIQDIGRRTGMMMTLSAMGALIGTPISGAINRATGRFLEVGMYAGSVIIVSVILMLVTRYHLLGHKLIGRA